jgi:addiction module HigA family antidote
MIMPTMHDPAHPGESLRDAMAAEGWTVTEAAAKLGCTRQTFSRVLNGKTGISPAMALALERIGWSNAAFWVRRQAQYDLARERIRQERAVA